jgi:hypothetical protein
MLGYTIPAEAGIQTAWHVSRATDPMALHDGLISIGVRQGKKPPHRTQAASLKMAITECIPYYVPRWILNKIPEEEMQGSDPPYCRIIRSLKNKSTNGYGVFLERKRKDGCKNTYKQLAAARVSGGRVVFIDKDGNDMDRLGILDGVRLQERYDFFKSHLGASEVGEVLTSVLEGMPNAVRLGIRKGRWHVSEEHVPTWTQVAQLVENCNRDTEESVVEIQPMVFTESSIRACKKALMSEVDAECTAINQELQSGLSPKATESRMVRAAMLKDKVDRYSRMLGEFEKEISSNVNRVNSSVSSALALEEVRVNFGI